MKVYLTSGTSSFLSKIKEKAENMYLLQSSDTSLLLHETDGPTVFEGGKEYDVLDTAGDLDQSGYAVLNNIPVTDEGRPIFEYRFENRAQLIEKEPGFKAIRVLRPLSNDIYVIFTLWEDEQSFQNWQQSKSFGKAHAKKEPEEGVEDKRHIFSSASYVTSYTLTEKEDGE